MRTNAFILNRSTLISRSDLIFMFFRFHIVKCHLSRRLISIFGIFSLVLVLMSPQVAVSAVFVTDSEIGSKPSDIEGPWRIKLFGEIDKNTKEQLEAKIEEFYPSGELAGDLILLYLDSSGGSFSEAIELAEYVSSLGIITAIDQNAICLSACAFVFMAGREPPYEGPGAVSRSMHVEAKLGFHAPFLGYGPQLLDQKFEGTNRDVSAAYQTGLVQMGQLLTGSGSTGLRWPPSLVGKVLQTSPSEYLYIETVDDAGRWNIDIFGEKDESLASDKSKFIACLNAFRWRDEEKWIEYDLEIISTDEYVNGWSSQVTKIADSEIPSNEDISIAYSVPIDNLNVLGCNIYQVAESEDWFVDTDFGFSGDFVTNLHMSPPQKRLNDMVKD